MADTTEQRIEKRMNKCVNFNGIMNDRCRAGIDYEELAGGRLALRRLPCLLNRADEDHIACPEARYPTREEAQAEIEESDRRIREYVSKIAEGVCPHCASEDWSQVGRCVYCNGCHARLYQGALPKGKRG